MSGNLSVVKVILQGKFLFEIKSLILNSILGLVKPLDLPLLVSIFPRLIAVSRCAYDWSRAIIKRVDELLEYMITYFKSKNKFNFLSYFRIKTAHNENFNKKLK
tara:strand:+ start:554 stop:865 length:312 start_codon:yes stop_codon:yes gene_type:complete